MLSLLITHNDGIPMKRLLIILMMTLNSPALLADNNRIDLLMPLSLLPLVSMTSVFVH